MDDDAPRLLTEVPGPMTRAWVDRLALRECPAITARRTRRAATLGAADDDPIVWAKALDCVVEDVDGNRYVDLTAGFGVASVGHANPRVVEAAKAQLDTLVHVMGDAFPETNRIRLLELLADKTGMERAILGSSGADAVEAALKTAAIASGQEGVLAFEGGYHGLSYGALGVCGYNGANFRGPFSGQLGHHVRFAPFGEPIPDLAEVGAVIVEPIQGRGGMLVPPPGWLATLRDACTEAGTLLIFDEIYTGFGRTGDWFAKDHEGVQPDLLCLGKGMSAGFPISACIGRAAVMDAWGASTGEALHTQTFLGHPVGCAMALATLAELEHILPKGQETGEWLGGELDRRGYSVRGRGLMRAVEIDDALEVSRALLRRGFIALPAGERAAVLAITPPLTIQRSQLSGFLDALDEVRR